MCANHYKFYKYRRYTYMAFNLRICLQIPKQHFLIESTYRTFLSIFRPVYHSNQTKSPKYGCELFLGQNHSKVTTCCDSSNVNEILSVYTYVKSLTGCITFVYYAMLVYLTFGLIVYVVRCICTLCIHVLYFDTFHTYQLLVRPMYTNVVYLCTIDLFM